MKKAAGNPGRNEPIEAAQRRVWRFGALAAAIILAILCLLFTLPLVIDFPYLAPTGGAPPIQEGLTATPPQGATEQQVTLTAEGLEPGMEVTILGGSDQTQMRVLGQARTDGDGNLKAAVDIPAWAERGKPFYFAVEANGKRVGLASVNVIVLDDVAPGGAGGSPPPPQ